MLECDALLRFQIRERFLDEQQTRRGFFLVMRKGTLSPKERAFVREYLVDQNGTQAAIRAGYAANSAQEQSSRLLSKDMVWAAVEAGLKKLEERTLVSKSYVIDGFKKVAESCLQKVPIIQGFMPLTDEEGNKVLKIADSNGANKALECLGKSIGIFVEKHEHSGTVRLEDLVGGSLKDDMEERAQKKAQK